MAYAYGNGSGGHASFGKPKYSYGTIFSSFKARKPKNRKKKTVQLPETSPIVECCDRHAAHDRVGVETSTYGRLPSGLAILRDPGACNTECPRDWGAEGTKDRPDAQRHAQSSKKHGKKPQAHTTHTTGKTPRAKTSGDRLTGERKHHHHPSHESSRSTGPTQAPSSQGSANVPQEEPARKKKPTKGAKSSKQKNGRGKWACFGG